VTVALLLAPGLLRAAGEGELARLIDAYRAEPRSCSGERQPAAGALTRVELLDGVRVGAGEQLGDRLVAAGYRAETATIVSVSGPAEASAALSLLAERYCRTLLDRRYAEVGVARSGREWRVVLAQPLLAAGLGEWRAAGQEVLRLSNAARAEPRRCGSQAFAAAAPLAWSDALGAAALTHSRDMAARNVFDHGSRNGDTVAERATRAGYPWKAIAENIAAGQGSPAQVVAGWLASPGHCANLMAADFAEMGGAYATDAGSDRFIYWTQVFGRR